jgi:hypothetical protein
MKDVAARGWNILLLSWNILLLSFLRQQATVLERHAKCKAVYCMLLTNINF